VQRITRFRPTPGTVIATIALLVALGGTGYAATLLPANSVGTAQVIDNSLLTKDFKAGQLPAGKPGPAGPSNAYAQTIAGPVPFGTSSGTIVSLQLPKPGSYVIWAKASVSDTGSGDESAVCQLVASGAVDRSTAYLPRAGSNEMISNVIAESFGVPGAADLICGSATGHAEARSIEVVAVKVGSLAASAG
jgi:hypothetical protein